MGKIYKIPFVGVRKWRRGCYEDCSWYTNPETLSFNPMSNNIRYIGSSSPLSLLAAGTWVLGEWELITALPVVTEKQWNLYENPSPVNRGAARRFYNISFYYNIASCAIWLRNMVYYVKGGIQAKDIWKQDPEANIWAQEAGVLSKFQQVNLQERDLWGGLGVDGRTILEWTLKR